MKKGLFIFLVSFFFLCTNNAFAHTGLESSTPGNGEIVKEDLRKISLTFETKIEQGSNFTILNSDNKEISVKNLEKTDNQLIGSIASPLENDDYVIKWEIIGIDGHIINGEYTFTVDAPVVEDDGEKNKTNEEAVTDTKEETTTSKETKKVSEETVDHSTMSAEEHAAYEKANSDPSTVLIPAILILVGIVVIIVAGFIITRKKK
ncbi:copper resistance protein CopC [Niallia taxi]|nr:copper resistance protein CopC [Niallia taxi]MDE5055146.1 copper resistance protein CopC [Niallia taxi]